MDQAGTLRRLMDTRKEHGISKGKPIRVISVTSGKGGVGKTSLVANLAVALQRNGHRVLVLDGDFGLANLNIVLGLDPVGTIHDVIEGRMGIDEIVATGPAGVSLIPASSGIFGTTNLGASEKCLLMEHLESISENYDILLIDTGAGINSDVAYPNAAAQEILVVATPEPTSIADAYALMKVMNQRHRISRFKLIVNMVENPREGLAVHNHLLNVSDRFLNIQIEYVGHVAYDRKMSQAIVSRKVVCDGYPDSNVAKCIQVLARSISESRPQATLTGNTQFFWRSLMSEVSI